MLELLLTQNLNPEYQEAGFKLRENKGKLYLYLDGKPVAQWSSTEVTVAEVETEINSLLTDKCIYCGSLWTEEYGSLSRRCRKCLVVY